MIAATAIVENCILVSADTIFPEIVNVDARLKLENWTV
jgi:predicted nucleic acid-binding protein